MREYLQIFTTVDDREVAERMASHLVEKRLAACVQILGPISSVYRWEDKMEKAEEWLLLIKSDKMHYPLLEKELKALHPYRVPEIVVTPITGGNDDYFRWIDKNLTDR